MSSCEGPIFVFYGSSSRCAALYGFLQHPEPCRHHPPARSEIKAADSIKAGREAGLHNSWQPISGFLKLMQLCVEFRWHLEPW